jgi:hypothetical protein
MPLTVAGQTIARVSVVDDDKDGREGFGFTIEDLQLQLVLEEAPDQDVGVFVTNLASRADAVLCDYHLGKHRYASFNGDLVVAECYRRHIPAVLCTAFTDFDITLMRSRRKEIPSLLRTNEADPELITEGWQRCVEEFQGQFRPDRRPWRALVRVDEVVKNEKYFYVIVPAWNPREKVRLMFHDVNPEIHPLLEEGKRLHAQVNTGAPSHEDLYFHSWEKQ